MSSKLVLKNSVWNILGVVIPAFIAIPALGYIARLLGVEAFGLFTLAFALVGFASIFDGGLSRAVIRAVAINSASIVAVRKIVGTSGWVGLLLSSFATVILWFSAPPLTQFLNVSASLSSDAICAFRLLAFSIPALLLSGIWLAYLEAYERFFELNIIKVISSLLLALLPLVFVLSGSSLIFAILGLVVGRVLVMGVAFGVCYKNIQAGVVAFDGRTLIELFRFGGWVTVSNIISPVMVYFDRFILANLTGAHNVAFYTAPAEAVSRLLIVPSAISRALFPRLSRQDDDANFHARMSFWGLLVLCVVLVIIPFIYAETIMTLWMGAEFSGISAPVLQVLLIGFVFNAVAHIPFVEIQAAGHSRATALVHLVELGPYLLLLYYLIGEFSVLGAAIAWSLRVSIDFLIMLGVSRWVRHRRCCAPAVSNALLD